MAEVYLATMAGPGGFEKHIALKVLLPHLTEDARSIAMLLDEARIRPHSGQTVWVSICEDTAAGSSTLNSTHRMETVLVIT